VDVLGEDDVRVEDQHEPDHDEEELGREVDDGQEDVEVRRLLDPDDVQKDEEDDHDHTADDVPRIVPQRLPEDREVVRHEERRDGDRDYVVEHLRPRGREGHELVEGVACEGGRPARLGEPHRPFRVGGRRRREDQAADDEDERREPQRDPGDQAEGVVDRGADVPVGGREERRRAEDALEPLLSTSPRHERTLERLAAADRAAIRGSKRSRG
jgi:hypothetical protein